MIKKKRKSNAAFDPRAKPDENPNISIYFKSEFAPSEAYIGSNNTELQNSNRLRAKFYNDHIHEVLERAIALCREHGLPDIDYNFGHELPDVSQIDSATTYKKLGDVLENENEQSNTWLSAICYLNYFEACKYSFMGAPYWQISERLMIAGATAREIELTKLNRKDALDRKKSIKAFSTNNEGRSVHNKKQKSDAKKWRLHAEQIENELSSGKRQSKAALASFIFKNWDKIGDVKTRPKKPAKKTIQNWLSEINK